MTAQKKLKSILFLIIFVIILVAPYFVFADSALDALKKVGTNSGYNPSTNEYSAADYVGSIVNVLFSILGIIFTVLMLYGGYNWMIAAGDNAKVETAKDTIKRAVIGLIIVAGAYAIGQFVVSALMMSRQN